ncbi:hypothetical protein BGZ58_009372 [Dissophora ornata]|nr:hypothetical protein BGZ58_009372 [Dissophora ornata]
MPDIEDLLARRPNSNQNDSDSVPLMEVRTSSFVNVDSHPSSGTADRDQEEHSTPFQQQQLHYQQQFQQQRQRKHYNVQIPTLEHWPGVIARGLKTSVAYLQKVTRGRGHHLRRLFFFFCFLTLLIVWIAVPTRVQPFQDRDVWIRYFNHEEAIKIVLPYGQRVHVQDVKKHVMKELDNAFGVTHTLGNVKLLARERGWLRPDEIWKNGDWRFTSSSYMPIIAVEPRFELFRFLNSTLGCFSDAEAYSNNVFDIKFRPAFNDYRSLWRILSTLHDGGGYLINDDIRYLRVGFNDPLKDEPITESNNIWTPPKGTRDPPHFLQPSHAVSIVPFLEAWGDIEPDY